MKDRTFLQAATVGTTALANLVWRSRCGWTVGLNRAPTLGLVAGEILNDGKYTTDGELQLVAVRKHLPDVLKVPPVSQHGNVAEIDQHFGGLENLSNAVNQLQTLLYAT